MLNFRSPGGGPDDASNLSRVSSSSAAAVATTTSNSKARGIQTAAITYTLPETGCPIRLAARAPLENRVSLTPIEPLPAAQYPLLSSRNASAVTRLTSAVLTKCEVSRLMDKGKRATVGWKRQRRRQWVQKRGSTTLVPGYVTRKGERTARVGQGQQ